MESNLTTWRAIINQINLGTGLFSFLPKGKQGRERVQVQLGVNRIKMAARYDGSNY